MTKENANDIENCEVVRAETLRCAQSDPPKGFAVKAEMLHFVQYDKGIGILQSLRSFRMTGKIQVIRNCDILRFTQSDRLRHPRASKKSAEMAERKTKTIHRE